MSLHESAEMYLETIYLLSEKSGSVRSIDVAESMGYSKPSVSRAVGLLKKGGYLIMAKDGSPLAFGVKLSGKAAQENHRKFQALGLVDTHNTHAIGRGLFPTADESPICNAVQMLQESA